MSDVTVYLIHLDTPLGRCQHYIGSARTERLAQRLAMHRRGAGSKFMAEAVRRGIVWCVARQWPGSTRSDERALKKHRHHRDYCPICNPQGYKRRGVLP